ncbi:autotransporter domain-containing protein [Bradyrhizobium sp. UFLA05-109]
MKIRRGALLKTTAQLSQSPLRMRPLALTASFSLSLAAVVMLPSGEAAAACVQSGNAVTCSGASSTGFGTGVESNLSVTVQSGAAISVGASEVAIKLDSGNTVVNSGAISSTGASAAGIRLTGSGNTVSNSGTITLTGDGSYGIGVNSTNTIQNSGTITIGANGYGVYLGSGNNFTNSGTINVGSSSAGVYALYNNNTVINNGTIVTDSIGIQGTGDNNAFTNAGTISLGAPGSIGMFVSSTGNVLTNTGTISSGSASSYGIAADGGGNTILNSGVITVGSSTSINSTGVYLLNSSVLTNSGTITAVDTGGIGVMLWSNGNTVTNNGTISAPGNGGVAIEFVGNGNTIVNSGTIRGGQNGFSLFTFGAANNTITNNGTLDGAIRLWGSGDSLTNNGLVTISDPATALGHGIIELGGTFTQSASGTLALRVDNAGNSDGLYAAGQVKLDGTLRLVAQPGLYQSSTTYTDVVQTATGVSGRFANVTVSSAFLNAAATYNTNSVDVTLTRQGFGSVAGETANQRAVGNALEAGYSTALTGAAATFYSNLLQAGSVRVLDQLSGEGTSGTQNTAFAAGSMFGQTMDGQMDAWRSGHRGEAAGSGALGYASERPVTSAFNALKAPPLVEPQWHAWASGFGAGQSLSGDATVGSAGFSDRIAGGAAGVDHLFGSDLLVGIAAGGSSATFNVDDRATSGRVDGAHVGAYAMQRFGATYVSAQLAYSHFNNSTTRTITGIGADEIAKGSFGSDQFGGRFEVGRTYDFGRVAVTPFAALQAAQLWQAGYTETSITGTGPGVLGLSYASRSVSSLPTFLGSKFDARFDFGNGMMWMPFASLAWVHEFSPNRDVTATLVSMPVSAFTVEGARAASDAGRVELGSRLVLNRWSELSARFTGEFASGSQSYAGTGTFRVNW